MKIIEEMIDNLPKVIKDKVFVAGSAATKLAFEKNILNQELSSNDIDLYLFAEEDYDFVRYELMKKYEINENNLEEKLHSSILADTFKTDKIVIQLIKPRKEHIQTFGEPVEVISKFDFSVIRTAYIPKNDEFVYMDFNLLKEDLEKRNLRIMNIVCPVSIIFRLMKYQKKGFKIKVSELIKIFVEWDLRPDSYRTELIDLIQKTKLGKLTNEDYDKLEMLLRVD